MSTCSIWKGFVAIGMTFNVGFKACLVFCQKAGFSFIDARFYRIPDIWPIVCRFNSLSTCVQSPISFSFMIVFDILLDFVIISYVNYFCSMVYETNLWIIKKLFYDNTELFIDCNTELFIDCIKKKKNVIFDFVNDLFFNKISYVLLRIEQKFFVC